MKVQAKHIDDREFIALVEQMQQERVSQDPSLGPLKYSTGQYDGGPWIMIGNIQDRLAEFPPKVVLAKFASLKRRGLLDGCACGCRGDVQVTELGRDFITEAERKTTVA